MTENRISIVITPEDAEAIRKAIAVLVEKLQPFLIALSPEDKRAIAKMGDKSVPFVEKIVQYCETNPEFVPAFMNVAEFKQDFAAFRTLTEMLRPLVQLVGNVDDTIALCGSETITAANLYYGSVKTAARSNVPNAKAVYDDLSVRYESLRVKKLKPAASPQ